MLSKSLEYARRQVATGTPIKTMLLENSEGILLLHPAAFATVCKLLVEIDRRYEWRVQWLCPWRHANVPNSRPRIYWLGTWTG